MITRRKLIVAATAAAIAPSMSFAASEHGNPSRPGSVLDQLLPRIEPVLDLQNAHTGEKMRVRFFSNGRYDRAAIAKLNHMFRDWRQDEIRQIDVRTYWGLAAIRAGAMKHGLSGRATINSGYRSKRTNDFLRKKGYGVASRSKHLEAKAADFTFEGANVEDTSRYARWLEIGGVGTYQTFTHIDSARVREWRG